MVGRMLRQYNDIDHFEEHFNCIGQRNYKCSLPSNFIQYNAIAAKIKIYTDPVVETRSYLV